MTIAQIKKEIIAVIQKSTETELEITQDTHLIQQMGLSSIEIMILVSDLENWFDITIPVSQLRNVQTVADLSELVLNEISRR